MSPRDLVALLVLAAVWGGSFLFIRVAVPAFGAAPLVAGRLLIAALVLGAMRLALRRRTELWRHRHRLLVLGAVNAAIPFTLISAAELHLTASLAAVLNATVPLFTALIAAAWLRERVTVKRALGLLLGFAGVAVLVGWSPLPRTAAVAWSVAAMLGATTSYAFSGLYTRRYLDGVPAPTLALGQQVAALVWLAVPAAATLPATPPPARAVAALLALGVLSTSFAYLLYFRLIARIGATRTTTVTYLIPVFGTAWGALFLGESLTAGTFAGLAAILASVVLVNDVRLWRRASPVAVGNAAP